MNKGKEHILIRIIDKVEPADVVAVIVILGVLFLNWRGINTMLSQAVSIIIGFYFGQKLITKKR